MSDVYYVRAVCESNKFGIRAKFQTIGITLCLMFVMWLFQFRDWSSVRPRYLIESLKATACSFTNTGCSPSAVVCLFDSNKTVVLFAFSCNRLDLYQSVYCEIDLFVRSIAFSAFSLTCSIIQSSAKR